MDKVELKRVSDELTMYELALKAWEYLSLEQERDAIKNIIRLRKEKRELLSFDYG